MTRRASITRSDILNATLEILRERGEEAINARRIADKLGCSTQPICFNFATMEELREALREVAYERYLDFLEGEVASEKYPAYKAYGMAYIRFAREEKALFKFLFMCDREGATTGESPDFTASVGMIMSANGITRERAQRMHFEMWSFVHGIGTMLATGFLSLDEKEISELLSDVYHGLQAVYSTEEHK